MSPHHPLFTFWFMTSTLLRMQLEWKPWWAVWGLPIHCKPKTLSIIECHWPEAFSIVEHPFLLEHFSLLSLWLGFNMSDPCSIYFNSIPFFLFQYHLLPKCWYRLWSELSFLATVHNFPGQSQPLAKVYFLCMHIWLQNLHLGQALFTGNHVFLSC